MKIRLTGFVDVEGLKADMGAEIEVTDDNRTICEFLLTNRAAVKLVDPADVAESSAAESSDSAGDNPDDDKEPAANGLLRADAVTRLHDAGIHGRYIKALTDANLLTVGDVAAKGDKLEDVPGISAAAAKQIAAVIAEELED